MKLGLRLLSFLGGLAAPGAVHAEEVPRAFSRVALLLPACSEPEFSASDLRSALALDLRDEGLTLAPVGELMPRSDVLVSLEAICTGEGELTLHADFEGQRHSRRVELTEVPPAERARALSLALAELLSLFARPKGATAESSVEPAPSEVPVAAAAAPERERPPAPTSKSPLDSRPPAVERASGASDREQSTERVDVARRWQLSLAPELRVFRTTTLFGGRALVGYARWSLGLHLLTANTSVPTGRVRTLSPHASFAYALPLWGQPDAALLEAGPRVGAGRTFMSATSSDLGQAASAEDVYLDAAATVRYSRSVARRWRVGLAGELGYAVGPIGYADDQEIARTSGVFASLRGDVAWQL